MLHVTNNLELLTITSSFQRLMFWKQGSHLAKGKSYVYILSVNLECYP